MRILVLTILIGGVSCSATRADDPVFSGPQVGEKLVPFKAQGVLGDTAGKEIDAITQANGKPVLLIFLHDPLTRPSAAVTRALSEYAALHKDKLTSLIVFLKEDQSAAEDYIRRASGSLNLKSPVAVSQDGVEGPGAYGLNRNVSLTVIVGNENKVTANFALIQPSTTEGPGIAAEVAKAIHVEPLSQEAFDQLAFGKARMRAPVEARGEAVEIPRDLLRAVINKQATQEQLEEAIAKVEAYVKDNPVRQTALGDVARRVVNGGTLQNYGTPAAQEQLKVWAKKYGPPGEEATKPKP